MVGKILEQQAEFLVGQMVEKILEQQAAFLVGQMVGKILELQAAFLVTLLTSSYLRFYPVLQKVDQILLLVVLLAQVAGQQ